MTDPSNPDLVEQLAEKLVRFTEFADGKRYLTLGWSGRGFWSFRQLLQDGVEKPVEELVMDSVRAAIREAISVTRRETLEQAAKLSVPQAEIMGTAEYREGYREGQAYIAAEIRRLGENK